MKANKQETIKKEYVILSGKMNMLDNKLQGIVTQAMKEGWKLEGGVSVSEGYGYQAMSKEFNLLPTGEEDKL